VKSAPELWTELSDPAKLARHLCELGEIRITATNPEQMVEWEADGASGTILIKPSGWGTTVTLTATRDVAQPEPAIASEAQFASEAQLAPEPAAEPGSPFAPAPPGEPLAPVASEPQPKVQPEQQSAVQAEEQPVVQAEEQPVVQAEKQPVVQAEAAREPPPGFFARLFRRRLRRTGAVEPEAPEAITAVEPAADDALQARAGEAVQPEAGEAAQPAPGEAAQPLEPGPEPPEVPEIDGSAEHPVGAASHISTELRAAEEVAAVQVVAEQVEAVLTSVLDRLGAAHHRPFSRA
jgi:hypothetical protein